MLSDVIEETEKFVLRFAAETVFFYTGEVVRYAISLGAHRPRWDFYDRESPARCVIFPEVSVWIAGAVWIFGLGFIARTVLR